MGYCPLGSTDFLVFPSHGRSGLLLHRPVWDWVLPRGETSNCSESSLLDGSAVDAAAALDSGGNGMVRGRTWAPTVVDRRRPSDISCGLAYTGLECRAQPRRIRSLLHGPCGH